MYNRYIPQPDGSYRRNQMPDNAHRANTPPPPPPPENQVPCPPTPSFQENSNTAQNIQHGGSIGAFLRKLIPAGLDTGDLLIIVLLLLMAGDCQEDQNTAILTLVLYLFL